MEVALGERVRLLRLRHHLGQVELAAAAGIDRKSLYKLETGKGSTVETLVRVLKAIGITDPVGAIAAAPQISPLAVLRSARTPRRVGRRRRREAGP